MSADVEQVTLAELQEAHRRGASRQIVTWHKAGQLADVLAGRESGHIDPDVDNNEPEPAGSADQGARVGPNLGQLTDADLKRLHAEGRHQEISAAHREGRLDDLLRVRRRCVTAAADLRVAVSLPDCCGTRPPGGR